MFHYAEIATPTVGISVMPGWHLHSRSDCSAPRLVLTGLSFLVKRVAIDAQELCCLVDGKNLRKTPSLRNASPFLLPKGNVFRVRHLLSSRCHSLVSKPHLGRDAQALLPIIDRS